MQTGQPSRTLLGPAIRRAAHQLLDAPLIFTDPIAVGLVPEASADAIRAGIADHLTEQSILLRSLFALRSRFTEDRLREAALRGVRQYVIVGAGLDTFPWRQPDFAGDMRIFAADHPSSLVWTQVKFWERGLAKPENLAFVPLDLERDRVLGRLVQFGFDPNRPAFFSVLGVTQYLARTTVDAMLNFAASLRPASEIVLSIARRADDLKGPDRDIAVASAQRAASVGEPWRTLLDAEKLTRRLRRLGFSEVWHLTPERAQQHYFDGRSDGLRPPGFEQLIAAVV